jgi:hypothetical protein
MAGTRLVIQSVVVVVLTLIAVGSIRYGFCRGSSVHGNLTKDFPTVPGLPQRAVIVEDQWWEEPLCHPIRWSINRILALDDEHEATSTTIVDRGSNNDDKTWSMTLAVENTTLLQAWMDALSEDFLGDDNDNPSCGSCLSSALNDNKMDVRILPEESSSSPHNVAELWEKLGSATDELPKLFLYIPSGLHPNDDHYWKLYSTKTLSTSFLIPAESNTNGPDLKSLVQDWIVRQQQQGTKKAIRNQPTRRLTREFQVEHFLAVLMGLLFPLLLPFYVSWIKEKKRYTKLTREKEKSTN